MARYAVKLGEIHLQSDTPITMDERKEAIKLTQEAAFDTLTTCGPDGLMLVFVPAP